MTKKLFYVKVTKFGWVFAENDEEAKKFADEIVDTEYFTDVSIRPYTEEYLNVSGWNEYSLVYHNGTEDITVEDALND